MSTILFEQFKRSMSANDLLCREVASAVLSDLDPEHIKHHFSLLLSKMQDDVYSRYLSEQRMVGQRIIDEQIQKTGTVDYDDFDRFYLSITQSRKSRAGRAFENIIKELLTRLDYPFAEQVDIEGAKPDYVMPSEEHFRTKPLDSIILTAKRTLRERWRQVVTEANKGYAFFLATIDDKISGNQLEQAAKHKIYIVVPASLKTGKDAYSDSYNVISFEQFFEQHLDPAMTRWSL